MKETFTYRPLLSEHSDFLPEEPLGESLLLPDSEAWRVWRPKSRTVVLGRSQKAEREINLDATREDAVPVFQRYGGGGCVVLDEHSVCIGLRYRRLTKFNISHYMMHSSEALRLFLQETYDLEVTVGENYDLLIGDRKFLGCSLYMPKGVSLYLAVILMERQAMAGINRYLKMPSKEPSHRGGRSHDDFLVPLGEHIPVSVDEFTRDLAEFISETAWHEGPWEK